MGTKGTCKTTLASLLVSHLELLVSEGEPVEGGVLSFNLAAAGTGLDVSHHTIASLLLLLLLFLLLSFHCFLVVFLLQSTLRFLKDQLPRKIRL